MDPITAISLASNVISFIDFGTKVLRGTRNVQEAGALEDNDTLECVARQMQTFIAKLSAPDRASLTGTDLSLAELADRCRGVANDLLQLLEKIKAKDPASKRQVLWSVIKNLKYDEEKRGLEARFGSCRGQLMIQLNFLAGQENRARLQDVLRASENNARRLEEVWGSVTHLRNVMDAGGFGDAAGGQMQQLYQIQEDLVDVVAQERVLSGIRGHGMKPLNERHDAICEAHAKTFEWLLSETEEESTSAEVFRSGSGLSPSTAFPSAFCDLGSNPLLAVDGGELLAEEDDILAEFGDWRQHHGAQNQRLESHGKPEDADLSDDFKARRSARRLFLDWLSSGKGVFHFSGKLGAGKSALMKLMCAHEHVRSLLEAWASTRNRKLVLGRHFFYNVGTSHQKSLSGMYRTLLHDVLESCPELARSVMPSIWAEARETSWQVGKEIQVPDRDVRTAFDHIVGSSKADDKPRLCFFIDGLDELEHTAESSHGDMVGLFHDWHRRSSGHIKLVVSSREHNVFINGFSPDQRICLHALTRQDLERFAQDKLNGIPDCETRSQIANRIVDKAQGIFFWVTLVVNSVRRRLEDRFDLNDVVEQIDDLPPEINDLFAYILDSLDTWTRRRAYRTLSMMLEATRWDLTVPVLGYVFLDEYEKTPGPDFGLSHTVKYRSGNYGISYEWTEKRLKGICKGLVECSPHPWLAHREGVDSFLQFGHRSVEEFLSHPERRREMLSQVGDFSAPEALTHIILLSKRSSGDFDDPTFWRSQGFYELPNILMMRHKHGLDKEPWTFLESLETWVDESEGFVLLEHSYRPTRSILSLIPSLASDDVPLVATPFYVLTLLGFEEYPVWKVRNAPSCYWSPKKVSLVIGCAFEHHLCEWIRLTQLQSKSSSVGPTLVRALLECGLMSWNTKMECALSMYTDALASSLNLLQQSFLVARFRDTGHSTDWIGIIIEDLLRHKPDLNFSISAGFRQDLSESDFGYRWVKFELRSKGTVAFLVLDTRVFKIDPVAECGPQQIVEASSFSNKKRILEMLQDQMSQASPETRGANSSVDAKYSQSQGLRPMATEVSRFPVTDRSPDVEQLRKPKVLETMTPDGLFGKVLIWNSTPANYMIAFIIGTTFGFTARHMFKRWWQG